MSINLNHELIVELGLAHVSPGQERAILREIYEVLELRVGLVLGGSLTERQVGDFEMVTDEGDEEAAKAYLADQLPEYGLVVRRELDYILSYLVARLSAGTSSPETLR